MSYFNRIWSKPFDRVFDGEGDPPAGDPPAGDPPAGDPPAGDPVGDDKLTLSQKQFNKALAEEKRKHQAQLQKQVEQLQQVQKAKGLTEKERGELATRIEELQTSMLSKEEQAKREKQKLESDYKTQVKSISDDRDTWKTRYSSEKIAREIMDEAKKADGWNESQFVSQLGPNTRVVEVLDEQGQPTGKYATQVKIDDVDKDGKPVTLELSVADAIKRMKEQEEFANFFKNVAAGGVGGNRTPALAKGAIDPAKMTTEQYREYRKTNLYPNRVVRKK